MVKVKTIMTEKVITVDESMELAQAAKIMLNSHIKDLLITKKDKPLSVITTKDVIKAALGKRKGVKVKDVMSKDFSIVSPEESYFDLIRIMKEKNVKIFPVVENDKLVGIVTDTDIISTTRDFTRMQHIVQDTTLLIFGIATVFFLFLAYT
jgi:tRNA nucleotidyltransferase (CCA-adding enzyme)